MLPVFMILRSKIYFMRAPARQRKYRIKELYRQTEKARQRRAFCVSAHKVRRNATPCRIPAVPEQAGQALRRAPHQIPHKSPALPDFYSTARAAAARPRPLCGREGGIVSGSGETGNVSRGDSVPLEARRHGKRPPAFTDGLFHKE